MSSPISPILNEEAVMTLFLLSAMPGETSPSEFQNVPKCVVRADDESAARAIADDHDRGDWPESAGEHPWLNAEKSRCDELTADGGAGLVVKG